MKKLPLLLIIIILTFTGCWDEKIIEDTGFMLEVGAELSKDNNVMVSFIYPEISAEGKSQPKIISYEVKLLREAREESRKKLPERLEAGKIQQTLFSEDIAKHGIFEFLEIFQRDSVSPLLAFVIVVDGSTQELMSHLIENKSSPGPSFYISKLTENNIKSSYVPDTRIYNFSIDYLAEGIDPITPIIKAEQDMAKVTGSALFSGDKMVGKIDTRQTSLLLAMMNKMKSGEYIFEAEGLSHENDSKKKGIAATIKKGKIKINVTMNNNKPEVDISLKLEGIIGEYKWDSLDKPEKHKEIENILSQELTKECNELIDYLQSIGSDPLGLGEKVRVKYNSYWKTIDWKEIYSNIKINVDVNIQILQHGEVN